MSVRYDPLLVRALGREIESRWTGARVRRLGLDPERDAASIRFDDGSALLALLHHDAGHLLACESDPLDGPSVRESRFGGARLGAVETEPDERALLLTLVGDDDQATAGIAIELHTNRWNALALDAADGEWRVRYALRTTEIGGRRLGPGEPYAMPTSTRAGIEESAPRSDWEATLAEAEEARAGSTAAPPGTARTEILRAWAWTSALNIDWLLERGADSFDRYRELAREAARPGAEAWLLPMRWGAQPYPLSLDAPEARRFPSLLDASRAAAREAGGVDAILARAAEGAAAAAVASDRERLETRLEARIRRTSKRIRALGRQLEAAGEPGEPREIGHLLLARKTSVPRGTDEAILEGFDGTPRVVALDPALDAVGNAERYFAEASRRERARERLPREIASAEHRLARLENALERVDRDGPTDELWEIAGGRRGRTRRERRDEPADRLPYATLRSSGGLEIRVGRGAKDNDDLTFRHSAPEDIWLHASQASGAHVILRWGRRDENPPGRDLREAATVAAVNSGGRHSGSVSVVWTRRKYVRKPRKSPPGAVVPDRVQTLMVRPDEALVRRLRESGDG